MSWFIEGEHVIGGSRGAAESIMERVRSENPSYWPHGLSIKGFDGGVWLVKRACDGEPIGFLGWQERNLRQGKTGFYAVGILPEHRGKGYAKEAVAKLINEKAASVDRVRAFIVPGNSPSERLASALGVPVTDSNGSDRVKAARWTSRKNAEGHADKHGEDFGGREAYLAFEKAVMEDPEILKRFENAG
jgi:GNAT superfamily N-acetyltransferase